MFGMLVERRDMDLKKERCLMREKALQKSGAENHKIGITGPVRRKKRRGRGQRKLEKNQRRRG